MAEQPHRAMEVQIRKLLGLCPWNLQNTTHSWAHVWAAKPRKNKILRDSAHWTYGTLGIQFFEAMFCIYWTYIAYTKLENIYTNFQGLPGLILRDRAWPVPPACPERPLVPASCEVDGHFEVVRSRSSLNFAQISQSFRCSPTAQRFIDGLKFEADFHIIPRNITPLFRVFSWPVPLACEAKSGWVSYRVPSGRNFSGFSSLIVGHMFIMGTKGS